MCCEYYQITERDDPDAKGVIVKVKNGKLETFAGSQLFLEELNPKVNKDDSIEVDETFYRAKNILETEAIKYKEDFDAFRKKSRGIFSQIGIA